MAPNKQMQLTGAYVFSGILCKHTQTPAVSEHPNSRTGFTSLWLILPGSGVQRDRQSVD